MPRRIGNKPQQKVVDTVEQRIAVDIGADIILKGGVGSSTGSRKLLLSGIAVYSSISCRALLKALSASASVAPLATVLEISARILAMTPSRLRFASSAVLR